MSRPIELNINDVLWLTNPTPGCPPGWAAEIMRTDANQARNINWAIESFGDALGSLPRPENARTLNLVLTHEGMRIIAWAATEGDCRAFTNQWTAFNPGLRAYPMTSPWPILRPGHLLRVFQLRLNAGPRLPIEHRFGRIGSATRDSPTAHLWASFPSIPPGSEVIVQLIWKKVSPLWRLLPWTQFGILEGPVDEEAILFKRGFLASYYLAIRIAERHRDRRHFVPGLAEGIAHAFGVYDRERSNGYHLDRMLSWSRSRAIRFFKTILEHDASRVTQHGLTRPRLMPLEAAALLHPPPPGQEPAILRAAPIAWREPPPGRRFFAPTGKGLDGKAHR